MSNTNTTKITQGITPLRFENIDGFCSIRNKNGETIATTFEENDAIIIVKAVNNHDALVDALRELMKIKVSVQYVTDDDVKVISAAQKLIAELKK